MNLNSEYVSFIGRGKGGLYGIFKINRKALPNGREFKHVLVSFEGNWVDRKDIYEYEHYEDVQQDQGNGLCFCHKEYFETSNCSRYLYDFGCIKAGEDYVLAVPATGEEFKFRIYGVDDVGALILLWEMEL